MVGMSFFFKNVFDMYVLRENKSFFTNATKRVEAPRSTTS
jgi:hypothetical protein